MNCLDIALTYPRLRDSEESAPAEYPPDQPEADTLDDDGTAYGAEEAEMQAALEKELEETDATAKATHVNGNQETAETKEKEEDEESEAGSEDLEEESSESDEDEEEEEAAEGEDTEMAEADGKPSAAAETNGEQRTEAQPEVMVH